MTITRLEELKRELAIINSMPCLALNIIEQAREYYKHEIECIEIYNSANPEMEVESLFEMITHVWGK